jgi:Transglutaminase-like superfamily
MRRLARLRCEDSSASFSITASFVKLRRKLAVFRDLHSSDRILIAEAALLLGFARLLVLTMPFRLLARWLERAPARGVGDAMLLGRVRRAVTTAARNVPWNAVCLPQAMAAKAMLARRGCGSSLRIGAGFDAQGKLIAHAWLVVGATVVVGAAGTSGVTPLTSFG